jgi:hypothetical protein
MHGAVLAVSDFVQATEEQYARNLVLLRAPRLFTDPRADWRDFDAGGMAAAQSYTDALGDCVLLLASIDETSKITFEQTQALGQLAQDATALDAEAAIKAVRKNMAREPLESAAEAVIVRAAFLGSLLGVYARAVEYDLIARLIARDEAIYDEARASMEEGVRDFRAALERLLPRFKHGEAAVKQAQTLRFPLLPVLIGHNKAAAARARSNPVPDLSQLETSLAAGQA